VTKNDHRNALSAQLARKLLPLALAIGIIISLGIPAIYYQTEAARARGEASTYARMLAENIRKLASEAPELWKYQATKYSQMISDFVPHKDILKINLVDEQKNTINQYIHVVQETDRWGQFSIAGEPAPVVFNNRKIGEATISVSGRSILLSTLLALLICSIIGAGLAFFAYRVPMKEVSRLERDILAYQESLEEKVEKRTFELQATTERAISLAEQAKAANRSKSEFLANMSHELRTPLNHIIGFTEIVVDRNFGPLNAQQEEFLGDVLTSGRHLLALINEILDLSKVEAGKMELEPSMVYLRPLMENSLSMIREKAMKHRIKLTTEIPELSGAFLADERKLKQILYNLLSNALKFTPDGGSIRVGVAPEKDDSAPGLRFTVADTGVGMNAPDLERIFLPFEQADNSASRKFQGTGLGLALTRKFVELHGGTIWAESEGEGKGSRFHFILPLQRNGIEEGSESPEKSFL
jgi:signal transduction histidine kinase